MLPTLALSATCPGIIYINGGFAGEITDVQPLLRPVNHQGVLYLDFRPLNNDCTPMTRRLVFSGGKPMPESAELAENLNVIIWPAGVVEIELSPRPAELQPLHFQLEGHSFALDVQRQQISCDARVLAALPPGAGIPECRHVPAGAILTGRCQDGQYLITCDDRLQAQTGFLRAKQIEIENDGRIMALTAASDLVGHATLETWRLMPEGLMLISSEPVWAHGAPRWPKNAAETARAAVEAALAGLDAEAERYLSPALRIRNPLAEIRRQCDLCVEMKYALPSARACVGLFSLLGGSCAQVKPLYFRASPSGGPQGAFQIDEFEFSNE